MLILPNHHASQPRRPAVAHFAGRKANFVHVPLWGSNDSLHSGLMGVLTNGSPGIATTASGKQGHTAIYYGYNIGSTGSRIAWSNSTGFTDRAAFTAVFVGGLITVSSSSASFLFGQYLQSASSTNADYNWGIYESFSSNRWFLQASDGTNSASIDSGVTVVGGQMYAIAVSFGNGLGRICVDGTAYGEGSITGLSGSQIGNNRGLACGGQWGSDSTNFGRVGLAALWNGYVASRAELESLANNPWQIFRKRTRRIWIAPAAGGATSLIIADAAHAHAADNITLTQEHILALQDAAHAHTADNVALTQTHILTLQDAAHAHTTDNVTLSAEGMLAVANALHAHTADNVALTQEHILAIADALHAHVVDNVELALGGVSLLVQEALHAHGADNVTLSQLHVLMVADALHAQLADSLVLALPGSNITITADRVLVVTSEQRYIVVIPESRYLLVAQESRSLKVS